MKKIANLLLFLLLSIPAFSQDVEMADEMRANGKIYVLVSIVLVILIGLLIYLIALDRKTSHLEKLLKENKKS